MQMTEELEKRLKIMQHFNQKISNYSQKFFYCDKIFVHNDIMYATDGHIFVVSSNFLTDCKDFSFFKCNNKKFEYMDSRIQEVKEIKEATEDGKNLENVLQKFNHASVSFDVDFGSLFSSKLCSNWSKRHRDTITINLQTEEAIIDFCGGVDSPDGVTANYEDIIKNVSGELPKKPIRFSLWHIMEIMKQCKVKKIHIESNTDKHINMCKVKDYTFIFTDLV